MCFSLSWLENLLIFIIIICAIVALIQLLIRFVVPHLGVGGEIVNFIIAALKIIFWAIICIAAVVFIFGLLSCAWNGGLMGGIPRLVH